MKKAFLFKYISFVQQFWLKHKSGEIFLHWTQFYLGSYLVFVLCTIGSGVFVGLLGVAYYAQIHSITYFILIQIGVGVFEVYVDMYTQI